MAKPGGRRMGPSCAGAGQSPTHPTRTTATRGTRLLGTVLRPGASGPTTPSVPAPSAPAGPAILEDAADDVGPAPIVALQRDDAVLRRVLQELRERRVPVVGLVEGRILPDHRLLHHRAPERVLVLPLEGLDGVDELGEGFRLLLREPLERRALLGVPGEVLVEDELVAVPHEELGGRVLH